MLGLESRRMWCHLVNRSAVCSTAARTPKCAAVFPHKAILGANRCVRPSPTLASSQWPTQQQRPSEISMTETRLSTVGHVVQAERPSRKPVERLAAWIQFPREHGAWGMLLFPFISAAVLTGAWSWSYIPASFAALAVFLIREPLTVLARQEYVWTNEHPEAGVARRSARMLSIVLLRRWSGLARRPALVATTALVIALLYIGALATTTRLGRAWVREELERRPCAVRHFWDIWPAPVHRMKHFCCFGRFTS